MYSNYVSPTFTLCIAHIYLKKFTSAVTSFSFYVAAKYSWKMLYAWSFIWVGSLSQCAFFSSFFTTYLIWINIKLKTLCCKFIYFSWPWMWYSIRIDYLYRAVPVLCRPKPFANLKSSARILLVLLLLLFTDYIICDCMTIGCSLYVWVNVTKSVDHQFYNLTGSSCSFTTLNNISHNRRTLFIY